MAGRLVRLGSGVKLSVRVPLNCAAGAEERVTPTWDCVDELEAETVRPMPDMGAETVKVTALLAPPEVVTVTLAAPVAALPAIVKVAVIWVALATLTLLTDTPLLLIFTVAPEMKLVPVSVTGTVLPCTPLFGLIEVRVGPVEVMVKVTALLVPADVVMVTLSAPGAASAAIVKEAVI